ncbi:hypothetical protein PCE1_004227 [Barthelona sp. PCE]
MIQIFADEDGKATIIRQNESGGLEPITLATEEYLNIFWVSRNEEVLATVHVDPSNYDSRIIKVFNIPELNSIFQVRASNCYFGCLSKDGQFLAYRSGDRYYSYDLITGNLLSNIQCYGSTCWVTSRNVFIHRNDDIICVYDHNKQSPSAKIEGMYFFEYQNQFRILDSVYHSGIKQMSYRISDMSGSVIEMYSILKGTTMLLGGISAQYIVLANNAVIEVFNRSTKQRYCSFYVEGKKQSIYISHDEKYFSVNMQCGDSQIFCIQSRKRITTIAKCYIGSTPTITVFNKHLIKIDTTQLGSYIVKAGEIIPCNPQMLISKVPNGYLLFFKSYVSHVSKSGECQSFDFNDVIVNAQGESGSVFSVAFEDGTSMLMEWDGSDFRRSLRCDNGSSNLIDANLSIINLRSKLAEQKIFFQEKLSAQKKETQVNFDALSQLVPNSGNKEFGELIAYSNECAEVIQQLYVPSQSFLDWISSDPTVQTMEKHLEELEMAISYVRHFRSIIVTFEINETLASTFSSRFDEYVSQFPIAKVLKEMAFAEKLKELRFLDARFELFHLLSDLDLKNSHVVMTLFIDKHNTLTQSSKQIKDIVKNLEESREEQEQDSLDHPVNFDRLYTMQQRMERHASEISGAECVNFKKAKGCLTELVTQNIKTLKNTICELALAVDLSKTLEELDL